MSHSNGKASSQTEFDFQGHISRREIDGVLNSRCFTEVIYEKYNNHNHKENMNHT
jgi:hypothetical protein